MFVSSDMEPGLVAGCKVKKGCFIIGSFAKSERHYKDIIEISGGYAQVLTALISLGSSFHFLLCGAEAMSPTQNPKLLRSFTRSMVIETKQFLSGREPNRNQYSCAQPSCMLRGLLDRIMSRLHFYQAASSSCRTYDLNVQLLKLHETRVGCNLKSKVKQGCFIMGSFAKSERHCKDIINICRFPVEGKPTVDFYFVAKSLRAVAQALRFIGIETKQGRNFLQSLSMFKNPKPRKHAASSFTRSTVIKSHAPCPNAQMPGYQSHAHAPCPSTAVGYQRSQCPTVAMPKPHAHRRLLIISRHHTHASWPSTAVDHQPSPFPMIPSRIMQNHAFRWRKSKGGEVIAVHFADHPASHHMLNISID
eukprot:gene307-908_t